MIMDCRIIRSRRKTVAIEITPQGEILVRCPSRLSQREIRSILDHHRGWIEGQLAKAALQPSVLPLTPEEHQALKETAKLQIPARVSHWAGIIGVSFGRISIRSQRTRWGSCSRQGNLNLNCLLLLAPPEVLDYVIVHELCHRKEMNHSPRFWAEVEAVLPDYQVQRKWLKDNGRALMVRLGK